MLVVRHFIDRELLGISRDMAINQSMRELSKLHFDCAYLPSINGPISCFYKPVTCISPPNDTESLILDNHNISSMYPVHSTIDYICKDDSLKIKGNKSITCQFSGQWSQLPLCIKHPLSSGSPLMIVTPLFLLPGIVFVGIIVWLKCKSYVEYSTLVRNKEFDAFICYDEADANFVQTTITSEYEEIPEPPFKLIIHQRYFKPSYTINWNIWNAIKTSNTAIVVMSQDFINSSWCREEFQQCYLEHMKDPALNFFLSGQE